MRKVTVSCIDTTPPKILSADIKGRTVTVRLTDDGTGVDPASLICISVNNTVTKASSFNEKTKTAVFHLPKEDHTLYFADKAGNQAEAPLRFKRK